MNRAFDKLTNN